MKSFIAGTAAAVLIAIAAWVTLDSLGLSSANTYSSANVRQ